MYAYLLLVDGVHVTCVYVWCVIYHGYQPEMRRCIPLTAHTTPYVVTKRDKIVPPSFKVLVKKKVNHVVKQTFCIADRRMVSVQCT